MTNFLRCSNFPAHYNLNGRKNITASRKDIMRALMTVGYPSKKYALTTVGLWRAKMLCHMVQGYIDPSLRTTDYFKHLEPSEKATVSFLFGQAFTLWFAQEYMDMYHLVHVKGTHENYRKSISSLSIAKAGALMPKNNSHPDFIGKCAQGFHVFETKGRSTALSAISSNNLMASALGQVSRISRINGKRALTRVACCFTFENSGVKGRIQDPEEGEVVFDLTFDERLALQKQYAPFFSEEFQQQHTKDSTGDFLCLEIIEGVTIGIDKEIYKRLLHISDTSKKEAFDTVADIAMDRAKNYISRRDERTSVGKDGILLIAKEEPEQKILQE